ncbi:MAG TPA: hypothetical protein VKR05_04460 [Candidatus Cybelea sp.]|nr:hypothetical protein [Candidatus Cybelea sp.]
MALTLGLRLIMTSAAVLMLSACGGAGTGGSFEAPSLARITEMTQPLATPPAVEGTYHGSYTEKRNGKMYSGKFRMVLYEQHNSKIGGRFDVRGGYVGKYNTGFFGKVRPSGSGAELRFDCPQLGGYDVGVEFRASVVGDNLTGAGHGGHRSQGDYQRWTLKATKN